MNFLKCLLKINFYGVWLFDWFLDKKIRLSEGKNSVQVTHCYTFLKEENKYFSAENFLKNGILIFQTPVYFSTLPKVAGHLAACTEGRAAKIAKQSQGEKVRKW